MEITQEHLMDIDLGPVNIDIIEENSVLMELMQDDLNFKSGIVQNNLARMANKPDRVVVQFRDLNAERDVFCLEFGRHDPCNAVVGRVAEKLDVDPLRIWFTRHICKTNKPASKHIVFQSSDCVLDMLNNFFKICNVLYYEVLVVPEPDLPHWVTLKVSYGYPYEEIKVVLPKHSKVEDLLNDLKKNGVKLTNCNTELRLVGIDNYKIHTVFPLDEKLEDIPEYIKLWAEEIPEEKNLGRGHHVMHVYHFTKMDGGQIAGFGKPFLFAIRDDETVADVKVRIQEKLSVENEEFSKWKFTILRLGGPKYLEDTDVVSRCFEGKADVWLQHLGLEHST